MAALASPGQAVSSSSSSSSNNSENSNTSLVKSNGTRSRDDEMNTGQDDGENRVVKRVYRGPMFDRSRIHKPLATLMEDVPLQESDIDSLKYSFSNTSNHQKAAEEDDDNDKILNQVATTKLIGGPFLSSVGRNINSRESDLEVRNRSLKDVNVDVEYAAILAKQTSPKRKIQSLSPLHSKRVFPLNIPDINSDIPTAQQNSNMHEMNREGPSINSGGGGITPKVSLRSIDSSPITSGEEESEGSGKETPSPTSSPSMLRSQLFESESS